jgi:asparagine synthetase B (glutamine-hydrolysing)
MIKNNQNYINALRNHLVGWLVIVGKGDENDIRNKIKLGLNSFVGDYGIKKVIKTNNNFGFGLLKPEIPLTLTTWSYFNDKDNVCFIEGVFYDEYFSHCPGDGEDQQLATLFMRKYKDLKAKAIEKLNGSFCGFIYDCNSKELITFVDRLGVKILYWSYEKGDIIVSSNLAVFRSLKTVSIDQSSTFQFLTIGFPIGEKTLLKDVNIQLPYSVNIYNGNMKKSICYWDIPERRKDISLKESVEMITFNMEDFVERIYNRTKEKVSLGLTGGHDSRVVCSALAYRNIPFVPINMKEGGGFNNFNNKVAPELCSIIKKQPVFVKKYSYDEVDEFRKYEFVYSDGNNLYMHLHSVLAKESFERQIRLYMVGFAGDMISGSLTVPAPQYLNSIKKLANVALNNQMELLSFNESFSLLRNTNENLINRTTSEWEQSFFSESSHQNLSDIAICQRLANRNLKRIRYGVIPAIQYVQIIFPYLDNKVLDAYFSLPVKFLNNQKAHCYSGFWRFKEFGNFQACGYPVSLKNEAIFPFIVPLLRFSVLKKNNLLSKLKSSKYKGNWNERHNNIYNETSKSPLFNSNIFKEYYFQKIINPACLYKMHVLKSFFDFYVLGENSLIPRSLLHK